MSYLTSITSFSKITWYHNRRPTIAMMTALSLITGSTQYRWPIRLTCPFARFHTLFLSLFFQRFFSCKIFASDCVFAVRRTSELSVSPWHLTSMTEELNTGLKRKKNSGQDGTWTQYCQMFSRLFTVPYTSVTSWRSSAVRYGWPSWSQMFRV